MVRTSARVVRVRFVGSSHLIACWLTVVIVVLLLILVRRSTAIIAVIIVIPLALRTTIRASTIFITVSVTSVVVISYNSTSSAAIRPSIAV